MSQTNSILSIPIADLITDPVIELSGRSKKERHENAQELVPKLKNGWDEGQPGQVFKRDGKWHVAAGFTRVYAIKELIKEKNAMGYFVEIPDEPAKLRTVAIRTNSGKDISALAKGKIFIQMRDGDDPEKLEKGQVALAPMTNKDIGDEVGLTPQGVQYAITLAESPESIRELMEEGTVNGNVVIMSKSAATDKKTKEVDEGKWMKGIKAAIKHAEANGKTTASKPDFDAIKDEVFPPAVLKAAGRSSETSAATPPAETKDKETETEETGTEHDAPKGGDGSQSAMSLGSEAPPADNPKTGAFTKQHRKDQIDALSTLLRKADEEYSDGAGIALDDEEIEHLATFVVDSGINVPLSPI